MAEVTLISSSGTTHVFKEQEVSNLKSVGDYVQAEVIKGTYIFYSNEGFNADGSGDHAILKPGPITSISNVNGSFYCLPDDNEGVILFAHPNFGGHHQVKVLLPYGYCCWELLELSAY